MPGGVERLPPLGRQRSRFDADQAAVDGGDVRAAGEGHRPGEFLLQDFEDTASAGLAECAEPPQRGTSYEDGLCSDGQRFENVGSASKAAVDQHWNFTVEGVDDFRKHFDRGRVAVEIAAAVVGNDDAIGSVLGGKQRVFRRQDAFD